MDGHMRKFNSQLEINDLIDDAVNNALARRNQVIDSKDTLSVMSNEEAGGVKGGQKSVPPSEPLSDLFLQPVIAGGIPAVRTGLDFQPIQA